MLSYLSMMLRWTKSAYRKRTVGEADGVESVGARGSGGTLARNANGRTGATFA
jgi:hypothetical protein